MNEDIRQTRVHVDGEVGIVIETKQDVTDIIESNKKQYNAIDKHKRWSGEPIRNKVATIPLTCIDELNKQGIMQGFSVLDEKKFRAWLNHPDNRFFRTRAGVI